MKDVPTCQRSDSRGHWRCGEDAARAFVVRHGDSKGLREAVEYRCSKCGPPGPQLGMREVSLEEAAVLEVMLP